MAKIPLLEIVKATGTKRREITLPPIDTTLAQERELARLYMPVVRAWAQGVKDYILPAYGRALAQALATDDADDVSTAITTTEGFAVQAAITFAPAVRRWAESVSAWHLRKIVNSLRYATNVDLTYQLGPAGTATTVEEFLARNAALIRNISDTSRARISDAVFRGLQQRKPVREVAKEITGYLNMDRARAIRVASDQTVKLSSALDRQRQLELGLDKFKWRHSDKVNYRPHHKARNGKVFSWSEGVGVSDPPGALPYCGCKALVYLPLDEDVEPI